MGSREIDLKVNIFFTFGTLRTEIMVVICKSFGISFASKTVID